MLEQILDPKTKQEEIQILFTLACSSLGFIASVSLPFLAPYLLLCGLSYQLILSLPKWENITEQNIPSSFELETVTKNVLLGIAVFLGVCLTQSSFFSQIIFCTATAGLSGGFFIHQCIIGSQNALNNALQQAVKDSDLEKVTMLLERGADPFASNLEGENCFHLVIQNNENALKILKHFKKTILKHEKLDTADLLASVKNFANDHTKQLIIEAWTNVKAMLKHFHRDTRIPVYRSSAALFAIFAENFSQCFEVLTKLLRQKISFSRKKINEKNQQGLSPLDLAQHRELDHRGTFASYLQKLKATETPRSVIPTTVDIESQKEEAAIEPATSVNLIDHPYTPDDATRRPNIG